jgi:hypothetical protein
MPCPPRTNHGRHAAAGSRSTSSQALVQLPSTQADPMRSRAGHARRRCTLHRAMASHSRRRPSRARHRLSCDVLSAGSGWTLRARLALTRGSALENGVRYILLSSRVALAIRAFALMISIVCSRSACRISREQEHRTQQHRHVAMIPVCLPGGYLLLKGPCLPSPHLL